MTYTALRFVDLSSETKDVLIALLGDSGYEGFEESEHTLQAYIATDRFNKDSADQIAITTGTQFSIDQVAETNWNAVWESNFEPVVVNGFCTIRADFHQMPVTTTHEIVITPKMSFGTGHHATTYMMIEQMSGLDLKGKTVLDFGTGTGVLAILAKKMGATHIVAIDNDEWSIANARENLERNRCGNITLIQADTASSRQQFDVILANITRNIIAENFMNFTAALSKNGALVLSGLLEEDEQAINDMAHAAGLPLTQKFRRSNWISLLYTT